METNLDNNNVIVIPKKKIPYNPKYYKKQDNPRGRPKGDVGRKQQYKKVRYEIIYSGKKYYATSLQDVVNMLGITRNVLENHIEYCEAQQKNDVDKIKTFSSCYTMMYNIMRIYNNSTSNLQHHRGVLDANFKVITKEEFAQLNNQSMYTPSSYIT